MDDWILKNLGSTSDPSGLSVIVSVGNTTLEGIVFTVDVQNSTLILQGTMGFSLISIPGIKSIQVLDSPKKPTRKIFNLPLEKLLSREEKAISALQLENSKIGIGVSKLAQLIFDELSKTLPTFWSSKDIIVMDEVLIKDPYSPDSCSLIGESKTSLQRVQKVLSNIHLKLGNKLV